MRNVKIERKTNETQINLELDIDGKGKYEIKTPVKFFTSMLESFSKWSLFDIRMIANGDIEVDQHHTIEDCGILLGKAVKQALGDKKGINRAGYFALPMDESLSIVAVDISGRPYLKFDAKFKRRMCGDLYTDIIEDFFIGFSMGLEGNISISIPFGRSDHHKIESVFKAFAKAMKMARSLDPRVIEEIPSTKGVIDDSDS